MTTPERTPTKYHLAEFSNFCDRPPMYAVEFTYEHTERVEFTNWDEARAAIKQFRADVIMSRVASSDIQRAKSARKLA